jgi:hypothetical protein
MESAPAADGASKPPIAKAKVDANPRMVGKPFTGQTRMESGEIDTDPPAGFRCDRSSYRHSIARRTYQFPVPCESVRQEGAARSTSALRSCAAAHCAPPSAYR